MFCPPRLPPNKLASYFQHVGKLEHRANKQLILNLVLRRGFLRGCLPDTPGHFITYYLCSVSCHTRQKNWFKILHIFLSKFSIIPPSPPQFHIYFRKRAANILAAPPLSRPLLHITSQQWYLSEWEGKPSCEQGAPLRVPLPSHNFTDCTIMLSVSTTLKPYKFKLYMHVFYRGIWKTPLKTVLLTCVQNSDYK